MSRRARWLAEWRKSTGKPVFYHVISRVVDRRFALGTEEKEKFRALMRLQEKFTGCRATSYCLMDNHFHILLEVPPMADGGLSDEALLKRLSAIYSEAFVAGVAKELADYRWRSYGEAIGGGSKGDGKTARAGLVRALRAHQGVGADAGLWADGVSREYRKLLMGGAVGKSSESVGRDGKTVTKTTRKGISKEEAEREREQDGEIQLGKMLRCRVRYFTDGAVIGSRSFVDEAFASARERFGAKRKDGARTMRGSGSGAKGLLWSIRDLHKGIS